jgi:hypothetical protein
MSGRAPSCQVLSVSSVGKKRFNITSTGTIALKCLHLTLRDCTRCRSSVLLPQDIGAWSQRKGSDVSGSWPMLGGRRTWESGDRACVRRSRAHFRPFHCIRPIYIHGNNAYIHARIFFTAHRQFLISPFPKAHPSGSSTPSRSRSFSSRSSVLEQEPSRLAALRTSSRLAVRPHSQP